jgi:hypothetical protein
MLFSDVYSDLKQYCITKSKSYKIINLKVWKKQEKEEKIDHINYCKEYWANSIKEKSIHGNN